MTKKDENLIDPDHAPSKFVAACLAMTPQAVSKLASEGVIRTNGHRGKYRLTEAIPQYISTVRRTGTAEAKARLAEQQERKLRLANDLSAGKLVEIDKAAEAFRQYALAYRAGINALPRRLANQLSNESNPALIQKVLANEFRELFETMEEPLREFFVANGQAFSVTETGNNGNGAAPGKNARPVGRRKKNTTARNGRTRKVAK